MRGGVPKWTKGTDCKSVIHGFESHRRLFPPSGWPVSLLRLPAVRVFSRFASDLTSRGEPGLHAPGWPHISEGARRRALRGCMGGLPKAGSEASHVSRALMLLVVARWRMAGRCCLASILANRGVVPTRVTPSLGSDGEIVEAFEAGGNLRRYVGEHRCFVTDCRARADRGSTELLSQAGYGRVLCGTLFARKTHLVSTHRVRAEEVRMRRKRDCSARCCELNTRDGGCAPGFQSAGRSNEGSPQSAVGSTVKLKGSRYGRNYGSCRTRTNQSAG
jgi:hypothetical protein